MHGEVAVLCVRFRSYCADLTAAGLTRCFVSSRREVGDQSRHIHGWTLPVRRAAVRTPR
jgi:hypothetical protein